MIEEARDPSRLGQPSAERRRRARLLLGLRGDQEVLANIGRQDYQKLSGGVMPTVMCGLVVSATGELIGCCFGGGRAKDKRAKFEFHRVPHLAKQRKSEEVAV